MSERTCSIDQCPREVLARGWCRKHYRNWAATGDPHKNLTQVRQEKPRPTCSIDNCVRPAHARDMCKHHYERFRISGDPLLTRTQIRMAASPTECAVDGCDRPIKSRGWCQAHYFRWYRYGDPGEAKLNLKGQPKEPCHMDGCTEDVDSLGLCQRHYYRYCKWGDPFYYEGKARVGTFNRWWRGDDVGYYGAHDRVTRAWGAPASAFPCVDCGKPALHWSYDHGDPDERIQTIGNAQCAYSTKVEHYQPRCVPCHKVYDLARLSAV